MTKVALVDKPQAPHTHSQHHANAGGGGEGKSWVLLSHRLNLLHLCSGPTIPNQNPLINTPTRKIPSRPLKRHTRDIIRMTAQHQSGDLFPRRRLGRRPVPVGETHSEVVHRHDVCVARDCEETVLGVGVDSPGGEGGFEEKGFAGWVLGKVHGRVARVVCCDEDFFTAYFADSHVCNGVWLKTSVPK
jgi:hypothetical protein